MSLSMKGRTYFSIQHIQSAALFARHAYSIEQNYNGIFSGELFFQHRAYVTGSILSSVFFLEAAINELFADTVEPNSRIAKNLHPETIQLMAKMWELGVPRTAKFEIMQKYQIALALARKQTFDPKIPPYQTVNLLVKLRNDLVHYEPEWVKSPSSDDFSPSDRHKYEKMLKEKFSANPLAGQGSPYYPDKCLGYGCADWAVNSSIKFADDFFSRMDLISPYNHSRDRLNTKYESLCIPDKKLAAVCGLFCPACSVFIGTREDPERLKKIAERLQRPVEELECHGCRAEKRCFYCGSCKKTSCAAEKGIDFCGECTEYPCEELRGFQAEMPHRIELWKAQERIKEAGYEKWYVEMIEHYSCPQCHTLNSAYDLACRKCGATPSCTYVSLHTDKIIQHLAKWK